MVHVTFKTMVQSDIKSAFTFLSDWRFIKLWDPNVPKSKKVTRYVLQEIGFHGDMRTRILVCHTYISICDVFRGPRPGVRRTGRRGD